MSAAKRIIPAHVPNAGIPPRSRSATGSLSSDVTSRRFIVVDSPPGRTRALTAARCSGRRTSTGSAPSSARIWACSRTSPCSARTPTFTWGPRHHQYARLPAAFGQLDVELVDLLAAHGVAQSAADLGDDLRIAVVRGGLDDGGGEAGGVGGLEDARTDEHRLRAQLHDQRCVSRRGDA